MFIKLVLFWSPLKLLSQVASWVPRLGGLTHLKGNEEQRSRLLNQDGRFPGDCSECPRLRTSIERQASAGREDCKRGQAPALLGFGDVPRHSCP